MKSLLYQIRAHKLAYALNVLGLSIALAAFYLFATQVEFNRTYNHSIRDHECIYRVEMDGFTQNEEWSCNIKLFAAICLLITIIGVFCLTMFETEYRRKEIAIRKVMGSSVGEVLSLFTRRYPIPLIISFVIAAPIGYYISEQWLQNFAEHTPIHWWIFHLAFLIVSMIVLLTVIMQCWRVATMNPEDSIKTE